MQAFRHLGLRIPENTLNGWFKPACELLAPLYEELKNEVLSTDYIQVDETTLPVIDNNACQAKKEYLWVVRSVMDRQVFFHYDDGSRSGRTAETLLRPFKGYLQSDGYNAYNAFEGNLVENAIRPIALALSRKNFLFCGNHQAAKNTAIICSLLASCKGAGINPREWLNYVIAKMPYYCQPRKTKNLKELLPAHWQPNKL